MIRWFWGFVAAMILTLSAAAQESVMATDRFNILQAEVETAKADLAAATDTSAISAARLALQESRVELEEVQRSFRTSKAQLEVDLGVLGPS
ncbi:MAG: hypothetical protein AAFW60_12800, partial [Pseudomonadota bacterium]